MNDIQQLHEKTVADLYLTSLRVHTGTRWDLVRAEDKFPELSNGTRWEFVAHRADPNEEWLAVEVKSLVFGGGESQHGNWHKLVDGVNKRLEPKLPGKYWLADMPNWTFNQSQGKALVNCLEKTIQEAAQGMAAGEQKDVGPSVGACFNDWPQDRRRQPPSIDPERLTLNYPPHSLILLKSSGDGSSLRIGLSTIVGYWAEPILSLAVHNLMVKGKANEQLGLAKSRGASKTVLLLDDHIDFDPQVVTGAISGLNASTCLT